MRSKAQESKQSLRRRICTVLNGLTAAQRAVASARACEQLQKQVIWRQAQSVLFYAPLPEELDLWSLLHDSLAGNKTVALPRFDSATRQYVACRIQNLDRDLNVGRFGIREPTHGCALVPMNGLDLVLVPGMAFDLQGRRLGRGKGFFDRLLPLVRGTTCGVAFDEQIVAEVPVEAHDVRVRCLLTPTRWIDI